MPKGEEATTEETILQVEPPVADFEPEDEPAGIDIGLLIVFVFILAVVGFSNVWLRKRAEREQS